MGLECGHRHTEDLRVPRTQINSVLGRKYHNPNGCCYLGPSQVRPRTLKEKQVAHDDPFGYVRIRGSGFKVLGVMLRV